MNIVIDTNIFISAAFWSGASEKIILKVEGKEISLVLSKEIIKEFSKVLNYDEIKNKVKDKNLEMKYTLHKIISISEIVEPTQKLQIVEDDPDDNKFIEAAVEGNASYIISNDKHLLNIGEFNGIKIIQPDEFLRILENN
jgi:hypothetical protein